MGWTLLALLHPRVHQVVDHTAHQHLGDLGQCDEHGELARQLEAGRPQGVVRVHDGVDQVVHGHEPSAASHHVFVGVPGVEQHGDVVVPVQEDELLFPQDDEESVTCRRTEEVGLFKRRGKFVQNMGRRGIKKKGDG